jgi:putative DNA primase/helicase
MHQDQHFEKYDNFVFKDHERHNFNRFHTLHDQKFGGAFGIDNKESMKDSPLILPRDVGEAGFAVEPYRDVPVQMKQLPQWVVWRFEQREAGKKPTKIPYNALQLKGAGLSPWAKARSNESETWCTFETACEVLKRFRELDGLGFCFSPNDGMTGIDLDNCINADGSLTDWAQKVVTEFGHTYIEVSPSKRGLHIFCIGKAVKAGKRVVVKPNGNGDEAIEIYDYTSPRYFTVTGKRFGSAAC